MLVGDISPLLSQWQFPKDDQLGWGTLAGVIEAYFAPWPRSH